MVTNTHDLTPRVDIVDASVVQPPSTAYPVPPDVIPTAAPSATVFPSVPATLPSSDAAPRVLERAS
jgi:hypothetical protein